VPHSAPRLRIRADRSKISSAVFGRNRPQQTVVCRRLKSALQIPFEASGTLAIGCIAAAAAGQVEFGLPCVIGGATSSAALQAWDGQK
jgi:hypothetical protein